MCFPRKPGLHYLRPGRLQADSWTHFSRVRGRELDRLCAHMRGLRPGQPRNGFRMEEEADFSNLKHRFSCQEILDSKKKKKKKKIIITKKRALQFAQKGQAV